MRCKRRCDVKRVMRSLITELAKQFCLLLNSHGPPSPQDGLVCAKTNKDVLTSHTSPHVLTPPVEFAGGRAGANSREARAKHDREHCVYEQAKANYSLCGYELTCVSDVHSAGWTNTGGSKLCLPAARCTSIHLDTLHLKRVEQMLKYSRSREIYR